MKPLRKKAALELSVGTIVVLVIAMSMLILGLVLVRNIFTGSIYNVKVLNDKVRNEINKLFQEEEGRKSVVYLAENKAEIKQGTDWGIAFSFKNLETGTQTEDTFSYEITMGQISEDCRGLSKQEAERWIKSRRTASNLRVPPGDSYLTIARFEIPDNAPLCIVPFDIKIMKGSSIYASDFFDIVIKA